MSGEAASQLFAWKKRLREADAPQFVAVEVAPSSVEAQWPVAVERSDAIEVRLHEGRSLVVKPGFDAHHLRALLAVLDGEA